MDKKLLLQDIANLLAEQEGISKRKAESFVRAFFDLTEEALLQDNYVKVSGFGTTKLVEVSERESVNINTGERFQISGHTKISFTPDNTLRDLVNRPFAHFTTITLNDNTTEEELEAVEDSTPSAAYENLTLSNDTAIEAAEHTSPTDTSNASTQPSTHISEGPQPILPETHSSETETVETDPAPQSNSQELYSEYAPKENFFFKDQVASETKERTLRSDSDTGSDFLSGTQTTTPEQETLSSPLPYFLSSEEITSAPTSLSTELPPQETDNQENNQDIITVNTNSSASKKTNGWKVAFIFMIVLHLLVLSYFAGYHRWFNNLHNTQTTVTKSHQMTKTNLSAQNKSSQKSTPSYSDTTATVSKKEETTPASGSTSESLSTPRTGSKTTQTTTEPTTSERFQSPTKTANKSKASTRNSYDSRTHYRREAQKYQQIPNASMVIVGTQSIQPLRSGENLYKLAKRIYGDRDFARYIIIFNHIENPDLISVGEKIKIPKLVKKTELRDKID